MSKKMIHTCIRVKDLEKSLIFYKEVLGMQEIRRRDYPENKFTLVYLALPGDDMELELTYNYEQSESYDLGNGYGHIAIGVHGLVDTHEELSQSGYDVTNLKGLSDGATSYFFIKDPDGYKIEIVQL
ncbi:VOC family protein [Alkalibacterium sp. 20]|uniref:lactoylglutathione lyase n=1 Tax=Alkalibacterium sp. 20 TaxID=1798803 RepID=UPI0009000F9E|nr:VOC family protein [Alkalibacterium sp. 20]OJF91612.1 lactoylglutathione lyase [Alkalibacterium sp. 20]